MINKMWEKLNVYIPVCWVTKTTLHLTNFFSSSFSCSKHPCTLLETMEVVVSPDDVSIEICRHNIDLLLWSTHAHNSHFVCYDVNIPYHLIISHGNWTDLYRFASWGPTRGVWPAIFFCGVSEQQILALTPGSSCHYVKPVIFGIHGKLRQIKTVSVGGWQDE